MVLQSCVQPYRSEWHQLSVVTQLVLQKPWGGGMFGVLSITKCYFSNKLRCELEHFWSFPGWHGCADGRTDLDVAGLSHEHALEHLGEVSQVKGVM